jgi:hypothetical protein
MGKSRNNPRPKRKRKSAITRGITRQLEHVANDAISRARLPNDPPSVDPGLLITKKLELVLRADTAATSAAFSPGSLLTPGVITYAGSGGNWKITLPDSQVAQLASWQVLGIAPEPTYAYALKKALIWGPLGDLNARAELALSSNSVLVQRSYDIGTRTSRPRTGLSIARPRWFSSTSAIDAINMQIGAEAGFSAPTGVTKFDIGTLHLTVMMKAQGILNDLPTPVAKPDGGRGR